MQQVQNTLFLIKPDLVRKQCYGDVIQRVLSHPNLNIRCLKTVNLTEQTLDKLYQDHVAKSFYSSVKDYMLSGPCIVCWVVGHNSVQELSDLCGATDPLQAHPRSIRSVFGASKESNGCHKSDSEKNGIRELKIFFDL